ncbi:MAG: hypothetical protein WDW38_004476 [Sanguina aurantia]
MIPASAGRQRKRKRAKKSKQSSEGQELEAAVVWELGVGVEDEQHSSTVVDLLGSFYSGCLPQGFPVALLLPAMQMAYLREGVQMCSRALCTLAPSDFPTLAVLGMQHTSDMLEAYPSVLPTAHHHLSEAFCHGNAEQILRSSTSCYAHFLDLPCQAVLALMDGGHTADFAQDSQTQLFHNWCCGPTGQAETQHLCSLTTGFPIDTLFRLPPAMRSLPAMSCVSQAASEQLLATFGDATAIVKSPSLLESFSWLPFSALLSLLRSDQLLTDTEATVLLLADHWLRTGDCSEEECTELLSAIRYSRLPSAYLVELGGWLRTSGLSHEAQMEIVHYRLSGIHAISDYSLDWFKPARGASPSGSCGSQTVGLRLVLSPKQMADLLMSKQVSAASELVYSGGFLWGLRAQADGNSVWLSIDVAGVASLGSLQEGVEFSSGVVCDHQLWLGEDSPHLVHQGVESHMIGNLSHEPLLKADGILTSTGLRWLEKLATKGHVTVSAAISNINP